MRVVRYPGGKAGWLDTLLPLIPQQETFVDVFGGGGSVILSRPPASGVDVYNDLDLAMTTLMRVLGDERLFERFHRKVACTLYSREAQNRAIDVIRQLRESEDTGLGEGSNPSAGAWGPIMPEDFAVEVAWAIYTQMNQSVAGTLNRTKGQWPKDKTSQIYVTQWLGMVDQLPEIHDRFRRVQVERRHALEVIDYWDFPGTSLYLDPPYVHDTRPDTHNMYTHEMTNEAHEALVTRLTECVASVTVSGYDHPIYRRLEEAGWTRHTFAVVAPMTAFPGREPDKREEVVWTNPVCDDLTNNHGRLF